MGYYIIVENKNIKYNMKDNAKNKTKATKKSSQTIEIKGKEYKIKYTIRALFIFEQITGKPFRIENLLDNYIFLYSMILANNQDAEDLISWDEFIDALDSDPTLFNRINQTIEDKQEKDKIFAVEEDESDDPEKKN